MAGDTPFSPGDDPFFGSPGRDGDSLPVGAGRPAMPSRMAPLGDDPALRPAEVRTEEDPGRRPPAPGSPRSSNLRGTLHRDDLEQERQESERLRREIDALRRLTALERASSEKLKTFSFQELTDDFAAYHGWRRKVRSKLLVSGVSRDDALKYMESVNAHSEEELKSRSTAFSTELEKQLDGAVFSAIQDALKGKSVRKHELTIER